MLLLIEGNRLWKGRQFKFFKLFVYFCDLPKICSPRFCCISWVLLLAKQYLELVKQKVFICLDIKEVLLTAHWSLLVANQMK